MDTQSTDAQAPKAERPKAVGRISNPELSPIEAIKAARGADGTVGLWATRDELAGAAKTATGAFLRDNVAVVRQPEFAKVPDEKGNTPRTGKYFDGKEGLRELAEGFGPKSIVRKVFVDVDALEAKHARGRRANKDELLRGVLTEHDGREDDRVARRAANLATNRVSRKEKAGKEM